MFTTSDHCASGRVYAGPRAVMRQTGAYIAAPVGYALLAVAVRNTTGAVHTATLAAFVIVGAVAAIRDARRLTGSPGAVAAAAVIIGAA